MDPEGENRTEKQPLRLWLKLLLGFSAVLSGLALILSVVIYNSLGQPIKAPDWLHDRIERRLGGLLPGGELRFGDLTMVVSSNGRPTVRLLNVEVTRPDGQVILAMSDLEAGLAVTSLFSPQVQLARVRLSGAEVNVARRPDGSFDLNFGTSLAQVEEAASLGQIVTELDNLLLTKELLDLRRVDAEALIVRYEDQRSGRAWTIDGGRLRLNREDDDLQVSGDLAVLGGHDYVTTVELNFESQIGSKEAQFGMVFDDMPAQDIAVQSAAVSWLNVVRAPISGALRGALDAQGDFGDISGTLQIAKGVLQPADTPLPIPFNAARSYFTFDRDRQVIVFDELSVDSNWMSARAEGKAILQKMERGFPQELLGQFTLTGLSANPDNILPEPLTLDAAAMTFRMQMDPFVLSLGEMSIEEQGQVITLNGRAEATPDGWIVGLGGAAETLDREVVLALWPETVKPKTRNWVAENVLSGKLSRAQLAYRKKPGREKDLYLGFEFDEAEVRFSKHYPLIQNGRGHAELNGKRFAVTADAGQIAGDQGGMIDIRGSGLVIPDVSIKPAPAQVLLQTDSTITSVLSLLDRPPLNLLSKANRPVDLADGRAVASGTLDVVLKKNLPAEEVRFDIDAVLSNVSSAKLVPNKLLKAPSLTLSANNALLQIKGAGRIGQVGFNALFEDDLSPEDKGKSKVSGDVEISNAFLQEFSIALPKNSLSGIGRGQFEIALETGQAPRFNVSSTLAGIGLRLPQIGWAMSKRSTGRFEATGRLSSPPQVSRLSLSAPGLSASGSLTLHQNGGLKEARFDRVKAGGWLNAPVTLQGRGKGRSPAVIVRGGSVDLLKRPASVGGAGSGGGPITASLDRLRVTDGIALTGVRGEFTTVGGFQGRFTATVNGQAAAKVKGKVTPKSGRSAVEITSENAGATVAATGILDKGRQGSLRLTLDPVASAGHYNGVLRIENTRVTGAPALAELLNALSVVGLLEQMAGSGIHFAEVDANFRLTPEQLIVKKSSAVGASMGLSLDGYYTFANKKMDFQGVLSPIYLLNAVGAIFTRKGEGLIGFNYNLRGTSDDLKVQVNPLSLFTPGMFREIFRRPAPKVSQ